eukprot:UN06310
MLNFKARTMSFQHASKTLNLQGEKVVTQHVSKLLILKAKKKHRTRENLSTSSKILYSTS